MCYLVDRYAQLHNLIPVDIKVGASETFAAMT